jgi:hypothetical protein
MVPPEAIPLDPVIALHYGAPTQEIEGKSSFTTIAYK